MAHPALAEVAAAADGAVAYQPGGGADTLKTVAGVAYIGLVIVYFFRLFKKRADMATSKARVGQKLPAASLRAPGFKSIFTSMQRLASTSSNVAGLEDNSDSDDEEAVMEQQEATPVACFM